MVQGWRNIDLSDIDSLDITGKLLLAEHGLNIHREKLLNDKSESVRAAVAEYGSDSQLDKLANDKSVYVRKCVVLFGKESHRDKLMNDSSWVVRRLVAEYGNKRQLSILLHDNDHRVSEMAKKEALYQGYNLSELENMYNKSQRNKSSVQNERKCGFKPSFSIFKKKNNLKM